MSRSLQQGQRSNQGHTMTLHTYTPLTNVLDYISAGVGLYETTAFLLSLTVESANFLCNQQSSVTGKRLCWYSIRYSTSKAIFNSFQAGVGLYETTAFFLSITVESADFLGNQQSSVTGKPGCFSISCTQPPKPFSIVTMQYSQH